MTLIWAVLTLPLLLGIGPAMGTHLQCGFRQCDSAPPETESHDPLILALPLPPTDGMPPIILQDVLSLAWVSPVPLPPSFRFEWSNAAAQHNMFLTQAIWTQPFSSITFSSEFQPVPILEPLCGHHPLWPCLHQYLTCGTTCPMLPLAKTN
jgi:hypothetical protein